MVLNDLACLHSADSQSHRMAWIYQRKGSDYWWLGWRNPDGRSHAKSTKCRAKTDAQKQLAAVDALSLAKASGASLDAVYQSMSRRSRPRVTVKAAVASWMTECEASIAPFTLARYRTVADGFLAFLGAGEKGPLVEEVTPDQVRQFLAHRRSARSASTLNLEKKILAMFFKREIGEEHLTVNPCASVKNSKLTRAEKGRRRAFTLDELKIISSKCPDDFWRFMLMAGFYTGQRMGDLIGLTHGAVDLQEGVMRLVQGKTGRAVQVPLRPALRAMLASLRAEAGKVKPSDFIWPEQAERYQQQGSGGFSNEFYGILTAAGLVASRSHLAKAKAGGPRTVSPVSFHSLRHTFVTLLKATGGSQAVAKELAGHSSDAVSDLYTHTSPALLASAIDALPEL